MRLVIPFVLGVLFLFSMCQKDDKPQVICDECAGLFSEKMIMYVDNELTSCPSNTNERCLRVQFDKFEGDTAWIPFEQDICGFDYEPGFSYVLDIQRKKIDTDAQGEPIYKYCLLYIRSKKLEPMK